MVVTETMPGSVGHPRLRNRRTTVESFSIPGQFLGYINAREFRLVDELSTELRLDAGSEDLGNCADAPSSSCSLVNT